VRPADVTWLKEQWQGPVVVKGVLTVADAVTAVDAGADAVVLSNHGGRQLDRAPVPLEVLPEVVAAVGDRAEVMVDSGIRTGSDVAAALALGASSVMVGRAYLYGLMVGGRRGVDAALGFLTAELAHTMALLGAASVADLRPEHVALGPAAR
jgi:L-lactate dehydrogenase (cytochrome)